MPRVRVYIVTFRRNKLLQRAVASLIGQTYTDWVCELHNDDPDDQMPQQLVESLADRRIIYVGHRVNFGAAATFNALYRPVDEEYISVLEDDNWFEPTFLEKMIHVMDRVPKIDLAWSNQRIWQELADGSWEDTQTDVWTADNYSEPVLIAFPQPLQCTGAVHSHGAMLVRARDLPNHQIPSSTPLDVVEHVRERTFVRPILFVPDTLANFAMTRQTARSRSSKHWEQMRVILGASFLKHAALSEREVAKLWELSRRPRRATRTLIWIAALGIKTRQILRTSDLIDWLDFAAGCTTHPITAWRILNVRRNYASLWTFLDERTKEQTESRAEMPAQGLPTIGKLWSKRLPPPAKSER